MKPVILCADDYAAHAGVSRGIVQLAQQGRLSATSVMVLSPRWAQDVAALREVRNLLDVGLHLDWTSEFAVAAGHGLSLTAAMARAVGGGFDQAAARRVIERQLDAFEAQWGAPPDHVDGHQHVQQFAGIRQPLVEVLAQRYGAQGGTGGRMPYLRVSQAPAGAADIKSRVIAALGANSIKKIADMRHLTRARALLGAYNFTGGQAAYAQRMAAWLAAAPAGCIIMCHPSAPLAEAEPDAIATARQWEFAYLGSDKFAHHLDQARVRLARGHEALSAPGALADAAPG